MYLAEEYRLNWTQAIEAAGPSAPEQLYAMLAADFRPNMCTPDRLSAWCAFWGEAQGRPLYQEKCGSNYSDENRLSGNSNPDTGNISFPKEFTRGYLSQELSFHGNKTVLQETETAFKEIKALEKRYNDLTDRVSHHTSHEAPDYMDLLTEWHDVGHRLEILGIGKPEEQMERILVGLGFARTDFSRSVAEFSGGWQMRIELAKLLLRKPDLLLLDEPTNHLDIEAIIWLEEFLQDYEGAVLLVSHDRAFLDRVTQAHRCC